MRVRRGGVFGTALAVGLVAAAAVTSGSGSAIGTLQPFAQFRGVVHSALARLT